MTDIAVTDNCKNPDSYGEICVRCNKCGRFGEQKMTREEAIAIIRKEYLCVDRDCDIERSCGRCDLNMPSKEPILKAYEMAIEALSQEPCEDAVSRKDAISAISTDYVTAVRNLEQLPPVTQKSGKWDNSCTCSVCGKWKILESEKNGGKYKFCPNCGARMFEPQESEEYKKQ